MNIPHHHLDITYRRIDDLKLDPRNPRRHSRKQIKQLARSIETFGFVVPALVDSEGNVIAGHGRILACRKLGWSEIPTVVIEALSPAKRRALMIADNRLAENASWDERLLAEQLKELSIGELDFSIEITGFELAEIDLKIAGLDGESLAENRGDAVLEPLPGLPVSKPGDLWLLGHHRVLCGSVLDPAVLQALMGEERATMTLIGRSEGEPSDDQAKTLGNIRQSSGAVATGERTSAFATSFARSLLAAERAGRRYVAVEPDPSCVDGIVRRWQKLTGQTTRHAETGRSFDDLAREAEVADAA